MCLGIPALVQDVTSGALPMATVEMAGQTRTICAAYTPEVQVGDYVLVQNGFSHTVLTADEAQATLTTIDDYDLLPDLPSGGHRR